MNVLRLNGITCKIGNLYYGHPIGDISFKTDSQPVGNDSLGWGGLEL